MTVHPPSPPPAADRIWHAHAFNVGTAGAKIFTGPAAEEFGYQVQQAANHEGKWYEMTDVAAEASSLSLSAETLKLQGCGILIDASSQQQSNLYLFFNSVCSGPQ